MHCNNSKSVDIQTFKKFKHSNSKAQITTYLGGARVVQLIPPWGPLLKCPWLLLNQFSTKISWTFQTGTLDKEYMLTNPSSAHTVGNLSPYVLLILDM